MPNTSYVQDKLCPTQVMSITSHAHHFKLFVLHFKKKIIHETSAI
jgi:hypothetical protein